MQDIIVTTPDQLKELIVECLSCTELKVQSPIDNIVNNEEYLNRKQTAKLLKISLVTLWKFQKEKKIPYYQVNRTILFKRSELLNHIKVA